MSYDSWKATNPADEFLGPEPIEEPKPRIRTEYWPKPIPISKFDWSAVVDDWDIGHPVGYGATEAEAINDLMLQLEEVGR